MSQIILSFGKIQLISSRLDLIKWSMSHETLQHSSDWYLFMRGNLNGGNWICTTRSLGHLVESAFEIFICFLRNSNVEQPAQTEISSGTPAVGGMRSSFLDLKGSEDLL